MDAGAPTTDPTTDDAAAAAEPAEGSGQPDGAPEQPTFPTDLSEDAGDDVVRVGTPVMPQGTVKDAVDGAEDANLAQADREALYDAALEYFLDDENDVIKNPIRFPIDIVREVELETGEIGERRAFSCEIRTLDDNEIRQVQQRARDKKAGPGGITLAEESDEARMHTLLCVEAITKPNIYDKRLIEKHRKPEEVLRHFMLPGERISLGLQILKLSGFGNSARSAMSLNLADVEAGKG